jgi:hypothetical protein
MLSQNVDDFDEVFYIISTTESQLPGGNTWIKESDNYDFAIDAE